MRIDHAWHQGPPTALNNVCIGNVVGRCDQGFNELAVHENASACDQPGVYPIENTDVPKQNRLFRFLCECGARDS
ncbi:hypothetical protein, partial [Bacillus subtilis]|uniref:hypothetical protein n=1 Tax=Bacillus subtilis TaxID=1423 RepID=UPI003CEB509D